jgi:hypothetical protein
MLAFLLFVAVVASAVADLPNELVLLGDDNIGQVIKTKMIYKNASELPSSWDWRTLGLLTTDLNQHIPTYW